MSDSSHASNSVIISVNPKAGRRSPLLRAEELQRLLQERGFDVELLTDLTEIAEKANALHAEGRLRALVGVGGDGTAATLVNLTTPGTPITLLSAGTANLLAKHFKLGRSPQNLAEIIAQGYTVTLDAGLTRSQSEPQHSANQNSGATSQQERLFLVMASCGFDADVVNGVHAHREQRYQEGHRKGAHISYFSYIKPILRTLFGYRFPRMMVRRWNGSDWETVESQARWAFVFNMNRYGWGLPLVPDAKENDGLLDHVLFRGGTVLHGIVYTAFAQCFGSHRFLPGARLGQSSRYRIEPMDENVKIPFQIDGDPGGILPIEIEIIPKRLTFVVPEKTARRFQS